MPPEDDAGALSDRLLEIADIIRATATSGLHWTRAQPYEQERYQTLLRAAAELVALVEERPLSGIMRAFHAELGHQTPKVAVGAAAFDGRGRILLVQRRDNGRWAIPGGFAEVGQTLRESVEREVFEETGLIVRSKSLIGIYDSRRTTRTLHHMINAVFECELMGGRLAPSYETPDVGFFAQTELPPLSPGHAVWIAAAFRRWIGPAFHGEPLID